MTTGDGADSASGFRQWLRPRAAGAADAATASTIPLLVASEQYRGIIGTGMLVRIADEHFILTAAHVVSPFRGTSHGLVLGTPAEDDDARPIPVSDFDVYGTKPLESAEHEYGPLDVAWVSLDPAHATRLSRRYAFLNRTDFAPRARLDAHLVITVVGFPTCCQTDRGDIVEMSPYQYAAQLMTTPPPDIEDFDPATQLLIAAGGDVHNGSDGSPQTLPRLDGMSGAGVWTVGRWAPALSSTPCDQRPQIVGVQFAVWHRRYIRAVRIQVALAALAATHPRLGPSLRLSLP